MLLGFLFFMISAAPAAGAQCDAGFLEPLPEVKVTKPDSKSFKIPRFVAVLIHGLNLKPSKMDSLGQVFSNLGGSVYRVTLSGHGSGQGGGATGSAEAFKEVTATQWLNEGTFVYCLARRESLRFKVPLVFVGYSLGGLIGERILQNAKPGEKVFDRVLLLAPALSFRTKVSFLKPLFLLGKGFTLTSANAPEYRAQDGTPMGAYRALFDLRDSFWENVESQGAQKLNVPTRVGMDPNDELVDSGGIQKWVAQSGLNQWKFLELSNEASTLVLKKHHLVIDETALGSSEWNRLTKEISDFLDFSDLVDKP